MKLLCVLLITLVAAMQNFRLAQGYPFLTPPGGKMCSFICELEYFPNINQQYKAWANLLLPLPTSKNDWNKVCQLTASYLACSKVATTDCNKKMPPMLRLAQIRDAYGYMCDEGALQFVQVVDCLTKKYKQNEILQCIQKREKTNHNEDVCITLENAQNCATENAMKACGQIARDFMSTFTHETLKYMNKIDYCNRFKVQTIGKPQG